MALARILNFLKWLYEIINNRLCAYLCVFLLLFSSTSSTSPLSPSLFNTNWDWWRKLSKQFKHLVWRRARAYKMSTNIQSHKVSNFLCELLLWMARRLWFTNRFYFVCVCALCLCSTTKISTKIIVNAIENEIDFLLPIRIIFRALFSFIVIFIIMIIIVLRLRASKMIFRTHKLQARPTKRRGDDLVGPSKTYATWERLINRQLHTHTHIYILAQAHNQHTYCV